MNWNKDDIQPIYFEMLMKHIEAQLEHANPRQVTGFDRWHF